ncbi:class F sortase [Streptomyces sp. ACA25]|uniref:class F sortase n=1 Tax=Streptomyces sp. ACA25 TaxID=3022596 RepID=UPI0023072B13|nr:class F sortase [Streptomyces sp. ACA25]MDB1086690.1 class F sortase [Streptomyces sp. ACA25]
MTRTAQIIRAALATTAAAASLTLAAWLLDGGDRPVPPQPSAAQRLDSGPGLPASGLPGGSLQALPAAAPTALRIPAIGVRSPLTGVGLEPDGSLAVPPQRETNLVGWFSEGVPPGVAGTALLTGHVDNAEGPAVFFRLGALRKGDTVEVERADGRTAVFTVFAVEVHPRDNFPDDRVYRHSSRPELRLITCGGTFSGTDGYDGNVVVYAHLTGTAGPH